MGRATTRFGDYSVHIEWQRKEGKPLFKQVKKDRRKVGEVLKLPDGKMTFWIERRAEDLVFCKDAWAIDFSVATLLRCLGRPDVGVVVSNGDRYWIAFDDFFAKKYVSEDPKLRHKYFVNFADFHFEKGEVESVEESMKVGKWK